MPDEEDSLTMAARHVAEGRLIVQRHLERIARLKAAGASTCDAEQTLDVFQSTLRILEEHEQALRADERIRPRR